MRNGIETRGAALNDDAFDATHPTTGEHVRVVGFNDDDPAAAKWLVAFTDKFGRKLIASVDSVAPPTLLGRKQSFAW